MDQNAQGIREIINLLNIYTKAYEKGKPAITDAQWDNIYFKLKTLEEKTGIIYPDSPTQKINYEIKDCLNKIKHNHLMLSLDKTKNPEEVEDFVKGQDWYAMFKMDGLTCSLSYDENGNLIGAETRGNGVEGEDILHNALVISSIPKHIPCKEPVTIDGEIICDKKIFNKYFAKDFANPRNFASGAIRLLSSKESQSKALTFIAWDLIIGCADIDFNFWRLEKLDEWGFITVPRVGDAETVHDAMNILDDMRDGKGIYEKYDYQNYPIDGYVFKFESKKYGDSLGNTNHHFKNAIAYKFYDEEYETTLKDIDYDVSRNGVLTPVAVYEPIEIEGSVCTRASLHNLNIMEELLGTPYFGQKIKISKANMIIPQVNSAEKRTEKEVLEAGGSLLNKDVVCPICGSYTKIITSDNGIKNLYCANDYCEGKLAQKIDHYAGTKGLDIKGISRKTIEKLIDWGWINGLRDIYKLSEHRVDWMAKEGFGEASVRKILDAIDTSKSNVSLGSFISALGMPLIGRTVAKEIVKYYSTWEDFRNAVGGDWTQFDGFGPEISKAINNFDYTEADEIAEFLDFKQPKIQNNDAPAAAIQGKVFVITGHLLLIQNRQKLSNIVEEKGGKVTSSISSKTNYLICNDKNSTSTKMKKAKELNIPILSEKELLELCNYKLE